MLEDIQGEYKAEDHLEKMRVSFGKPTTDARNLKTALLVASSKVKGVLKDIWEVDAQQFELERDRRDFMNMTNVPIGMITVGDEPTPVFEIRGAWERRPSQPPLAPSAGPERGLDRVK